MKHDWFSSAVRQLHMDFHNPEYPTEAVKDLDPEEFVYHLARAKVQALKLFTKDHYGNCYYDTKIGHKHSGLAPDMFGSVLEECHRKDIKVIAYYSICWDIHAAEHNPDWRQRDAEGKPLINRHWQNVCVNSPYREELALPQLREISTNYEIDGFWLDIVRMDRGGCFCPYCMRKFGERYGMELTGETAKSHPEKFHEFKIDSLAAFLEECNRTVLPIRPGALMSFNGCCGIGSSRRMVATATYGTIESQPAWGGYFMESRQARYARTLPIPFEILTVRFMAGWGEWTLKPVEQLKFEFATILSNGGVVACGDQNYPSSRLEPAVYDRIGEAFAFVEEREEFCIGAKTVKHTAVLFGGPEYKDAPFGFYHMVDDPFLAGADKALQELHCQFDILDEEGLHSLSEYRLLIIPRLRKLKPESVEIIPDFVKKGGNLVVTGLATLGDGKRFDLGEVLGITFVEASPYSVCYMEFNRELQGRSTQMPLLMHDPFIKVTPTKAKPIGRMRYPMTEAVPERTLSHQHAPPGLLSLFPAATINQFGKGKALYISTPIFKTFWEHQHTWLREVAGLLLALLKVEKPYTVDAGPAVQANLMRKGNELLLHLVNYSADIRAGKTGYEPIEDIPPRFNIPVAIRSPKPKKVTLEPGGRGLDFTYAKGCTQVIVPELKIHAIVRVQTGHAR